jgi:ribosome recycling factor
MAANIGITPQNDGINIRLFMPPLTEERRKELFKKASGEGEVSKVAIRNIRRDHIEQVKKLQKISGEAELAMKKAINHLEIELTKIRAGKATPSILEGINVDYYGTPTPISQVANVQVLDSRTISIQPWEKNMLPLIERSIMAANIGITPQNDGINIRLFMPPLTEERRKELFKKASGEGEVSKVAIRNIRRDHIEQVKKLQKDGTSEDICKGAEDTIQSLTDKYIALVEKHLEAKEKEMMTV